jgi:hypothetical protein
MDINIIKLAEDYNKALNDLLHGGAFFDTNCYEAFNFALSKQGVTDKTLISNYTKIFDMGRVTGNLYYTEIKK